MSESRGDRAVPDPAAEPTISVIRAGRILGMGRNAAYAAARDGRLPTVAISPSRAVVVTAEFLDRFRLTEGARVGHPQARRPECSSRAAETRITAQWQLDGAGSGRLVLSCRAWPRLAGAQRYAVARAVADAAEAEIGRALGDPGRLS